MLEPRLFASAISQKSLRIVYARIAKSSLTLQRVLVVHCELRRGKEVSADVPRV